jgi:hypothetical protein
MKPDCETRSAREGGQAEAPVGEIIGQDLRHAQFVNHADLLIHDAQYTAEEYPAKVGRGHSSIEYVCIIPLTHRVTD